MSMKDTAQELKEKLTSFCQDSRHHCLCDSDDVDCEFCPIAMAFDYVEEVIATSEDDD